MYVVSCPYVIYYPTVISQYSLFVLKVHAVKPQANKQNKHGDVNLVSTGNICAVRYCLMKLLCVQILHLENT